MNPPTAAWVEPLPDAGAQTPRLSWRGRPYVFRRRLGGPFTSNRWDTAATAAFSAGLLLLGLWLVPWATEQHRLHPEEWLDIRPYLFVAGGVALLVYVLLCSVYERVIVDHTGIRYETWLGGPLAFLAPLYPSWQLRWRELRGIHLAAKGLRPMGWSYQFTPVQGRVRRLNVFSWRTEDQEDCGAGFRDLSSRDPARLREALTRTRLFALVNLAARAVTESPSS